MLPGDDEIDNEFESSSDSDLDSSNFINDASERVPVSSQIVQSSAQKFRKVIVLIYK